MPALLVEFECVGVAIYSAAFVRFGWERVGEHRSGFTGVVVMGKLPMGLICGHTFRSMRIERIVRCVNPSGGIPCS